jgi:HAD superfamily hydrolase (TIGR01509 family)
MNERRWDAVIFDMDGVLCDSEAFICEAACRMFQETHGVAVRPEDFLPFVGTGENRYLGGVAEQHGVALRLPEDKDRVYAIYLERIVGRLQALPGAREFVARCRSLGLKTAVATSADRIKMDGNLREIGLAAEAFDALVYGELVTHKKPDPEIFVTAARRVGVEPARCLVVEDALSGVAAAKAAGSECLALTSSFEAEALRRAGADFLARDLADAMPLLAP